MLPLVLLFHEVRAITLEEAWHAADADSVPLKMLHEQTKATEALRTQAWAYVGPKVQLNGSYTINEYPIVLDFSSMIPEEFQSFFEDTEPITVQKERYWAANASVIQPLFSGSALPAMTAVKRTVESQREKEKASRNDVRAGIARAYYGLVVARAGKDVAEQALANAKVHLDLAKAAVAAGTAAPTAELQAELAVARGERDVLAANEGVVTAGQALARLTGLAPDVPVEMPAPRELPFADLDQAIRAADTEPDVVAADRTVQAARAQETATHLTWMPDVSGRFTYSYTQNTGFNDDPTMWMIVFEGSWLLWDSGARIGREQAATANRHLADLAADQSRIDAHAEVTTLWETQARAQKSLDALDHELKLAEDNNRIAEVAYKAGTIRFIELEDARLGLQATRLSQLQQRMDRDLAIIDLLAATGKL